MAKGNLSPRQKMINLMYLVFIAMLAIQIDQEVLRSFQDINTSIENSVVLSSNNNKVYYDDLADKSLKNPERYKIPNARAQELKAVSDDVVGFIEDLKIKLGAEEIRKAEDEGEVRYNVLQDTDKTIDLFFKGYSPKEGNDLAKEFVNRLKAMSSKMKELNVKAKDRITKTFNFDDVGNNSWIEKKFYEQPTVASLTNLTKIQSDIRTEEGNIVRDLLTTKPNVELDLLKAIPVTPGVVELNKPASFDVFAGAFSSSVKGSVEIDGNTFPLEEGKAKIELFTSSLGIKEITGKLTYTDGNGVTRDSEFTTTYQVVTEIIEDAIQKPEDVVVGVVTADKTNVVYRGLENPISVNLSGAIPSSVSLAKNGAGKLTKIGQGKYTYVPASGNKVSFVPSGRSIISGKTVSGQPWDFRIKNIPPAQGQIRGEGGKILSIPAASLGNQRVTAAIPGFIFDVNITVNSFKVKIPGKKTITCSGNRFNASASAAIKGARGAVCVIYDIKATANNSVPLNKVSPVTISLK